MQLIVFTNGKRTAKGFDALTRSRTFDLSFSPPDRLKAFLKKRKRRALVYVDLSCYPERERAALLRAAARCERVRYGVVDPEGSVDDVAGLFHQGAADYIDKELLSDGVTTQRIKALLNFRPFPESPTSAPEDGSLIPSGNDWDGIESGREYTFCCMFVELDMVAEWRQESGAAHIDEIARAFHTHIERATSGANGRIWMWTGSGGVVLFPFDGTECDPVPLCTRLVLNRAIINAEEFGYNTAISYRIVLHIGNLEYKARGDTGTIVSNTLNFLFHLGQQHAQPGCLYLTESVIPFLPSGLDDVFLDAGSYDGVRLLRQRRPVRFSDEARFADIDTVGRA